MLPNESADSGVFWNGLLRPILCLIPSQSGFDQKVLNEWDGEMWNLLLYEGHICLVDL
jgi:hypothetical protein